MNSISQYLREIENFPILSKDEQVIYIKKAQEGDSISKEILINSNLRLVVSIAKKYANFGIPLLDLIQEGSLGLIKAIERFDLKKDTLFSTYAVWWIKQGIFLYLKNNKSIIRFPVHAREGIEKVSKFIQEYFSLNNKYPSDEVVSENLGISVHNISFYKNLMESSTLSLESNIADGVTLHSIVSSVDNFEAEIVDKIIYESLYKHINFLTPKERDVIINRYGLFHNKKKSLDEIGKNHNLTKERIRQIQINALKKLQKRVPESLFL